MSRIVMSRIVCIPPSSTVFGLKRGVYFYTSFEVCLHIELSSKIHIKVIYIVRTYYN